jgi:hypothetical protein
LPIGMESRESSNSGESRKPQTSPFGRLRMRMKREGVVIQNRQLATINR